MADFEKTEDGVLDYKIDYSSWLASGDSISSSVWTLPAGLVEDTNSFTPSTTTILISGGTLSTRYSLKNKITTVSGLVDERCFHIRIVPCRD